MTSRTTATFNVIEAKVLIIFFILVTFCLEIPGDH